MPVLPRALVLGSLILASWFLAAPTHGQIVFGGFEPGDTALWDETVGIPIPTAFRFTDLDLRDPHLFVGVGPLCFDVTDVGAGGFDSFNEGLEASITLDGDMDGMLDLNLLLLFRPLDVGAVDAGVDRADGLCSAPLATTTCDPEPATASSLERYGAQGGGICLDSIAGTTSGYTPMVDISAAPCFVTVASDSTINFGGIEVTLGETQIAATFVGDPPTSLVSGLLRGFLTEADANAILLPPELGGGPLSALLPGGTGSCATDDGTGLDDLNGVPGWWFYLNFEATEVPYSGP